MLWRRKTHPTPFEVRPTLKKLASSQRVFFMKQSNQYISDYLREIRGGRFYFDLIAGAVGKPVATGFNNGEQEQPTNPIHTHTPYPCAYTL